MGVLFFLPIFLFIGVLYVLDKVLALILSIILAIYSLIKMHKKQPTGKIFTVITTILIILKLFVLPIEVIPCISAYKTISYTNKLNSGNYAVAEEANAETFTYKGKEYVEITFDIRRVLSDKNYFCDLNNTEMFEKTTEILFEEDAYNIFMYSSSVLYQKKDAPDDRIVYVHALNTSEEVWCLKEYAEEAIQTYTDKNNLEFYIRYEKDGVEKTKKLSPEIYDEIEKCMEKYEERDNTYFPIQYTEGDWVGIDSYSTDKRFYFKSMLRTLKNIDGKLYFRFDYAEYDCLRDLNFELD